MVNDLLQTHHFQEWTRRDVVALLGAGEVGSRPECETYIIRQLGIGNSAHGCLRLTFGSHDTVTKHDLVIINLPI
jgi:hypothetical protein